MEEGKLSDDQEFGEPEQPTGTTAGREHSTKTDIEHFNCQLSCCKSCHFCARAFPKERSPVAAVCQYKDQKLKYVKSVSCVTQLSSL